MLKTLCCHHNNSAVYLQPNKDKYLLGSCFKNIGTCFVSARTSITYFLPRTSQNISCWCKALFWLTDDKCLWPGFGRARHSSVGIKSECSNKCQCKSSGWKAMNFRTVSYGLCNIISSRNVDSSGYQCQWLAGSPVCGCSQHVSSKVDWFNGFSWKSSVLGFARSSAAWPFVYLGIAASGSRLGLPSLPSVSIWSLGVEKRRESSSLPPRTWWQYLWSEK